MRIADKLNSCLITVLIVKDLEKGAAVGIILTNNLPNNQKKNFNAWIERPEK